MASLIMHHLPCEWERRRRGREGRKEAGREGIGEFILFWVFFFRLLERSEEEGLCHIGGEALYFSRVTNSGQVPTHYLKGGGWRQMRLWRVSWAPGERRYTRRLSSLTGQQPQCRFFFDFPSLTPKVPASLRSCLRLLNSKTLGQCIRRMKYKEDQRLFFICAGGECGSDCLQNSLVFRTICQCWGSDPTWQLPYLVQQSLTVIFFHVILF